MTDNVDDETIWDSWTRAARRQLITRITREHPAVTSARVTCNQAPLQVQGDLDDGRIYLFHARNGYATLAIAVPNQPTRPNEVGVPCSDTLSVDDDAEAATLFAGLLTDHPDHP